MGHSYRGSNGRHAITRLRNVGLLPRDGGGFADDEALSAGVGFTDLVERPTTSAREPSHQELESGRAALQRKLAEHAVPLVVCVFRPAVEAKLGEAGPPGFQTATFGRARVFRMPGPYLRTSEAGAAMDQLAGHLGI